MFLLLNKTLIVLLSSLYFLLSFVHIMLKSQVGSILLSKQNNVDEI